MPKGKKGGKKKEEAAKKKVLQKYHHLKRELQYGQLTLKKCEKEWKRILMQVKSAGIRAELEIAWHSFEILIDHQNYKISLLLDELANSREQSLSNSRNHVTNIDNLITLYHDQINELKLDNESMISKLHSYALTEMQGIEETHKESESYMKTMLYAMEQTGKEQEKFVRGEYMSKKDVEISKLADIGKLKEEELLSKYRTLWSISNDFLTNYGNETAPFLKKHDALKIDDLALRNIIVERFIEIGVSNDFLRHTKNTFSYQQIVDHNAINQSIEDRNSFDSIYRKTKKAFNRDVARDEEQLEYLVSQSGSTAEFLNQLKQKSEKILHYVMLCAQLETNEEKILRFPVNFSYNQASQIDLFSDVSFASDIKDLKLFWILVGQVECSRKCLIDEKKSLEKQINALKREIHKYCKCMICSQDTGQGQSIKHETIPMTDLQMEIRKYEKYANHKKK